MSHWKAKVDQETIPEQLGDMPIVVLDNFGTHPLICTHHIPVLFGIESPCQGSCIYYIAEHDRELPSFRVECTRGL
jgi:hypothetical protein